MKSYAKTDVGMRRSMNQDSLYCSDEPVGSFRNLFIVADGMGGHRAGDTASRMCIENMISMIQGSDQNTPVTIFEEACAYANQKVYQAANSNPEYEGMGTTMVACTLQDNTLFVANIGDSRLYLLHDHLQQITNDHSLVEEMVKIGNLTESEARIHPQKNIITRALGIDEEVQPDFFEIKVSPGDIILLCSDGLSNMVEDEDMEYLIRHTDSLEQAGDALVKRANANGGSDNITAVLVQV